MKTPMGTEPFVPEPEAEAIALALEELAESEFLSFRIDPETGVPAEYPRKKFRYSDRLWMKTRAQEYRTGVRKVPRADV